MGSVIKKAIFPVGGLGTRFLPATKAMPKEMLPVVDKPLIQYAVEEAAAAGIEEFIFVTGRGKHAIEDHFDRSLELELSLETKGLDDKLAHIRSLIRTPGSVAYVRQQEAAGLGHAIWCARHFVNEGESVAVLLADDLILPPKGEAGCLSDMIAAWHSVGAAGNMVASMQVAPCDVSSYGIITPDDDISAPENLIAVKSLVEKPSPESAPSNLAVVGRYIIESGVFDILSTLDRGLGGEFQLTDALAARIGSVPFHGFSFSGTRYDCGSKLGFLQANIAFALSRDDLASDLSAWLKAEVAP